VVGVRCGAQVDLERLGGEIADPFAGLGVPRPTVAVTAVKQSERDQGAAKLKRFVPLAAAPKREPRRASHSHIQRRAELAPS
jgi:type IV pilus biogenesis protein CpaD/CtpE